MPHNSELKIETGLSVRVEPVHPTLGHEPQLPAVVMLFGRSDEPPPHLPRICRLNRQPRLLKCWGRQSSNSQRRPRKASGGHPRRAYRTSDRRFACGGNVGVLRSDSARNGRPFSRFLQTASCFTSFRPASGSAASSGLRDRQVDPIMGTNGCQGARHRQEAAQGVLGTAR